MKSTCIAVLVCALSVGCAYRPAEQPASLLGHPIPVVAASKTIVLTPSTQWVNVVGGDAVRFRVGDRDFAWAFDVASSVKSFDLSRVAPEGMLGHPVIAYVSPDPKYIGGGGGNRSK